MSNFFYDLFLLTKRDRFKVDRQYLHICSQYKKNAQLYKIKSVNNNRKFVNKCPAGTMIHCAFLVYFRQMQSEMLWQVIMSDYGKVTMSNNL